MPLIQRHQLDLAHRSQRLFLWNGLGPLFDAESRHSRRNRAGANHNELFFLIMITVAGATFQTDKVFVGVLVFALAGMLGMELLTRIEARFNKWRPKVGSSE